MRATPAVAIALGAVALAAQTADSPTIPNLKDVNPEILKLVIQDQWDRGNDMFGGREAKTDPKIDLAKNDEERHRPVRQLLADGKLQTGRDYQFAALIFQHSSESPDLLLAHSLAVTAIAKSGNAKWLAAATLDRYLWSVKQPQVFGTQFLRGPDDKWTNEPYNREALSDAIRAGFCVIPVAEQAKILSDAQTGKASFNTGLSGCK